MKRKEVDPFETPIPSEIRHFEQVIVPLMDIENIEEKLSDLKNENQTQLRNLKINILTKRLQRLQNNKKSKVAKKLKIK